MGNKKLSPNKQRSYSSTCVFGKTQLVNFVWDVLYMKNILKLSTRANRGAGTRKRMSSHAKLPGKWKRKTSNEMMTIRMNSSSSQDTGVFLRTRACIFICDKVIIFILLDGAVSSSDGQNIDELQPCMLTRRCRHAVC